MTERRAATETVRLQLARDDASLPSARQVAGLAAAWVDVMEVGTILAVSAGLEAVRALRDAHPAHLVAADIRIARAGRALADLAFDAGADWVTVVSEAPADTVAGVVRSAQAHDGHVHIDLGAHWDDEDLRRWAELGVSHAILHRTHEADAPATPWAPRDFEAVERIDAAGLKVVVTGGVTADQLVDFTGLPVDVVIAGRAIGGAPDVGRAARDFRAAMDEVGWR